MSLIAQAQHKESHAIHNLCIKARQRCMEHTKGKDGNNFLCGFRPERESERKKSTKIECMELKHKKIIVIIFFLLFHSRCASL